MSGKTTIGKRLAKQLNWNFIDTDQLIEEAYLKKTGRLQSCPQIYIAEGGQRFRELEKEQIALLNCSSKSVIALGGGTLCDPDNLKVLQLAGDLIYLKTPTDIIWMKLQKDGIPSYLDRNNPEKDFYAVAEKRIPLYEQAADHIIETNHLNEEGIVAAILRHRKEKNGE
jgi:shikimate kinase